MATLNEIARTLALQTTSQHGKQSTRPAIAQASVLVMSPASITELAQSLGGLVT